MGVGACGCVWLDVYMGSSMRAWVIVCVCARVRACVCIHVCVFEYMRYQHFHKGMSLLLTIVKR